MLKRPQLYNNKKNNKIVRYWFLNYKSHNLKYIRGESLSQTSGLLIRIS